MALLWFFLGALIVGCIVGVRELDKKETIYPWAYYRGSG